MNILATLTRRQSVDYSSGRKVLFPACFCTVILTFDLLFQACDAFISDPQCIVFVWWKSDTNLSIYLRTDARTVARTHGRTGQKCTQQHFTMLDGWIKVTEYSAMKNLMAINNKPWNEDSIKVTHRLFIYLRLGQTALIVRPTYMVVLG